MAEKSIFTSEEIRFLRVLDKNEVRFIIIGLAAATLQGVPVVTQDVDLRFENLGDPGLRKALRKVNGAYVPKIGLNPPTFAGDSVNLFDIVLTMHGLGSFDEEWPKTLEFELGGMAVHVMRLDRIIQSKQTINRDKDRLVLPVLKDILKTIEEFSKKK